MLTPEDHTTLLAETLAKGHTISIDGEGTPSIIEPSRSKVPLQTEEIINGGDYKASGGNGMPRPRWWLVLDGSFPNKGRCGALASSEG